MIQANRQKLRVLIDKQFGKGINKKDLFDAFVEFLDYNYPTTSVESSKYFTSRVKNQILHDLAIDIRDAGGLEQWKKKLITSFVPIIGSLPPTTKKKKHYNEP